MGNKKKKNFRNRKKKEEAKKMKKRKHKARVKKGNLSMEWRPETKVERLGRRNKTIRDRTIIKAIMQTSMLKKEQARTKLERKEKKRPKRSFRKVKGYKSEKLFDYFNIFNDAPQNRQH